MNLILMLGEFMEKSLLNQSISQFIRDARNELWETVTDIVRRNSVFKVRIGKQNRITIPDAEVEALGVKEGDLVQVIIIPLNISQKKDKKEDV